MKPTLTQALVALAVLGFATPIFAQMSNTTSVPPENAAANPVAGDGSTSGTPSSSSHYKATEVHHKKYNGKVSTSASGMGTTDNTMGTTTGGDGDAH